jgi:hypothetical protein
MTTLRVDTLVTAIALTMTLGFIASLDRQLTGLGTSSNPNYHLANIYGAASQTSSTTALPTNRSVAD